MGKKFCSNIFILLYARRFQTMNLFTNGDGILNLFKIFPDSTVWSTDKVCQIELLKMCYLKVPQSSVLVNPISTRPKVYRCSRGQDAQDSMIDNMMFHFIHTFKYPNNRSWFSRYFYTILPLL